MEHYALDGVGKDVYLIKDNKVVGEARSVWSTGFVVAVIPQDEAAKALVADDEFVKMLGYRYALFRFSSFGDYVGNDGKKFAPLIGVMAVEKERLHWGMCDPQIFAKTMGFKCAIGRLDPKPEQTVVRVKFPMRDSVWTVVVIEALDTDEKTPVYEECIDYFIVEYETQQDFDKALARFAGMIEYEVLK